MLFTENKSSYLLINALNALLHTNPSAFAYEISILDFEKRRPLCAEKFNVPYRQYSPETRPLKPRRCVPYAL
jgi:hypothetical protein